MRSLIPRALLCALLFVLSLAGGVTWAQNGLFAPALPPPPEIHQTGPHDAITIRAVGLPGHWSGFDVVADEQVVAPVRFTSHELIFSSQAIALTNGLTSTLTFDALQAAPDCGVTLEHSRIVVTLSAQQYPTVTFDLRLAAFDVRLWQQAVGVQPFHFLTLAMPDATVWHQGGWLYPTPRADLFPLLLDPAHPLNACTDNREWSRTPALSAHALPVIGLWSPTRRVYAGWDMQEARLGASPAFPLPATRNTQNDDASHSVEAERSAEQNAERNAEQSRTEHDIATGFCNRLVVAIDPFLMQTMETAPPIRLLPDSNVPQSKNGQPPPRRDSRLRKLLDPSEQASREYDTRGVSKFVALITPPQTGADGSGFAYPASGVRLASHATLLFHTDLGGMDDPNRFCWERWWNTPAIQSRLARVPRVNDLGWIPDALHLRDLPAPPADRLLTAAPSDAFLPGTLRLTALLAHNENMLENTLENVFGSSLESGSKSLADAPASAHDTLRRTRTQQTQTYRAQMQADTRLLRMYARRFTLDKEPCLYWPQPLMGEWTPTQGGESAATLHNPDGWTAGRLLLHLWREQQNLVQQQNSAQEKDRSQNKDLLPFVDGVFNWTKQVVWTRGGRSDAPSLPTARDGAAGMAFLLDYYFTFKDDIRDGEHRARALQALDMARSFAYRYLPMWADDPDGDASQYHPFAWQAPHGSGKANENKGADSRDTKAGTEDTGAAVASEDLAAGLDALAQVAVHTGDPNLLWALQGSVYGEGARHAVAGREHFSRSPGEEGQNGRSAVLFSGPSFIPPSSSVSASDTQTTPGMTPYTEPLHSGAYSLLDPVGDTNARVICGLRAAVCFDRGERDIVVTNYRCGQAGEFAFTVRRLGARGLRPVTGEAIRLTVTFPGIDLSRRPVAVRHGNLTQRTLEAKEIARYRGASWSFLVHDLRDGDTLVVGNPDLNAAEVLPSTPPLAEQQTRPPIPMAVSHTP